MAVSFGRAAFLYLFLIITMRLMGKRQVGQMEPSEVVVAMLMADLASIPMDDPSIPLYQGIVPLVAVLVSVTVLGESMTFWQIVGGVLILGFTLWNEITPKTAS